MGWNGMEWVVLYINIYIYMHNLFYMGDDIYTFKSGL
jgi:hypothetical protein